MGSNRSGVLELAVLGLLHETPMHGYELRKRLNSVLGAFRAFSYGSLYPCLKQLLAQGLIVEEAAGEPAPGAVARLGTAMRPGGQLGSGSAADPGSGQVHGAGQARPGQAGAMRAGGGMPAGVSRPGRRSKIVYRLTADGKERLQDLLSQAGPAAWEDDGFGVHFAFFSQTRADVRLRILEGRRTRLEERMENVRGALSRTRERVDSYTLELQRHGLDSVEREVRWLNELIASERTAGEKEQS